MVDPMQPDLMAFHNHSPDDIAMSLGTMCHQKKCRGDAMLSQEIEDSRGGDRIRAVVEG
jgi:hypothetical protein